VIPLDKWAQRLEAVIAAHGVTCVDRAAVVARCDSTQDAAKRIAGGRTGVVVLAGRQVGGRGRLGREWADTKGLGLAVTFVLDANRWDQAHISLVSGVAACRAIQSTLGSARVGLRWPNDVVEAGGGKRKLAGVLVERTDGTALVGIGTNVLHTAGDHPSVLAGRAVSLCELGSTVDRLGYAERLLVEFDRTLAFSNEQLASAWRGLDVLIGTTRTFEHDGSRITGTVIEIDPDSSIIVQLPGGRVGLPAASTSLVAE